ncbi:hypothetical protein JCM1393_22760 [Clostridium carnis]
MRKSNLKKLKNICVALLAIIIFNGVSVTNVAALNNNEMGSEKKAEEIDMEAILVDRDNYPQYFIEIGDKADEYFLDVSKLPLDGKIYKYIDNTNPKFVSQRYFKIINIEKGIRYGEVKVTYIEGIKIMADEVIKDDIVAFSPEMELIIFSPEKYNEITNVKNIPSDIVRGMVYERIPEGKTVEEINSISTLVDIDNYSQYLTEYNNNPGEYFLDIKKIPFDGKIYRHFNIGRERTFYLKIIKMEKGSENGMVKTTYVTGVINEDDNIVDVSPNMEEVFFSPERYREITEGKINPPAIVKNEILVVKEEVPVIKNEIPAIIPNEKIKENIRLGGKDRIETSIKVADNIRGNGKLNAVLLSSYIDFPDSLTGAILNTKYDGPTLLVRKTVDRSLDTLNYVEKNANKDANIIILGGEGVVDNSVISYLKSKGFNNIKRLGGKDRFETNRMIVNELAPKKGTPVIISYAFNYPDALSISSISAAKGYPIFLVGNSITEETKNAIKNIAPSEIIITGGTGVISKDIEDQLKGISSNVNRLGGSDRYVTSLMIAERFKGESNNLLVASALDFPDSLSGAYLGSKVSAPTLIVSPNNLDTQKEFIKKNNKFKLYILGGQGVINDQMVKYLEK